MSWFNNKSKTFVDNNPDNYYDYIQIDTNVFYQNISGQNDNKQEPYLIGKVKSVDNKKCICTFTNGTKVQFYQTLQIINNCLIDVNDMADVENINVVYLLNNLWNRLIKKKHLQM